MQAYLRPLLAILASAALLSCGAQKRAAFNRQEVYKSENLLIVQIAENAFQHISYKQTNDFGNVPCNGLVVRNQGEAIVFDTPTTDQSSGELIKWIEGTLACKIKAVVPTHFHDDCLGGLKTFTDQAIPSYAHTQTIELAKANHLALPQNGFRDSVVLNVGSQPVIVRFFGEGHTKDNVIGYFPHENILFGGCLIKALDASKGFLGDANVEAWAGTVAKVRAEYPNVTLVVPGHGAPGNQQLLDYTINLFNTQQFGEQKLKKGN
jgi:metallo-beta-lactamase class B